MKWHLDPTHVTRTTGDLIQNILLDTPGERYEDFGQKVFSGNIDSYIQRTRKHRQQYIEKFPKDLQEVLDKAEQTKAWRKEA